MNGRSQNKGGEDVKQRETVLSLLGWFPVWNGLHVGPINHKPPILLREELPGPVVINIVGSWVPAKPFRFELWGAREVLSLLPIHALGLLRSQA